MFKLYTKPTPYTLNETQEVMFFKNDLFRFLKKTYFQVGRDYEKAIMVVHYTIRHLSDRPLIMPEHLETWFPELDLVRVENIHPKKWMVMYYRSKGEGILKIAKKVKMSPNTVTKIIEDNPVPFMGLSDMDKKLLNYMNGWKVLQMELEGRGFTLM